MDARTKATKECVHFSEIQDDPSLAPKNSVSVDHRSHPRVSTKDNTSFRGAIKEALNEALQEEEQEFEPEPWVDLAISLARTIAEGLEFQCRTRNL
jgi:hypothetical protein